MALRRIVATAVVVYVVTVAVCRQLLVEIIAVDHPRSVVLVAMMV